MIRKLYLDARHPESSLTWSGTKYDLGFVLLLAFLGGAIIFVLWPYL
jgi:hypothetical protein